MRHQGFYRELDRRRAERDNVSHAIAMLAFYGTDEQRRQELERQLEALEARDVRDGYLQPLARMT